MMDKNTKKDMGLSSESPKLHESPKAIGEEPEASGNINRADDGLRPDYAGMRKNRNRWLKQKLRIGTWNMRSMGAGKLESIILEANENCIDIIGMAEQRWQWKGHFTVTSRCGGKVLHSGGERAGQNGVAIYLSKGAAQSLMGYNPVNDRLISVRLGGQAKNVKLIQVYAPTSAATDEEIETFYVTLQQEINNKDRQDILIISGDLNARVGAKQNVEEDGILGNAGQGERNERGHLLVEFAMSNQLAIKKTPCFRSILEGCIHGHLQMGKQKTKLII